MRRRKLLAGGIAGTAALLSGCLGGGGDSGGEDHGSAPVIFDGVAAYAREDGHVYGIDLDAEREQWRVDTGGQINLAPAEDDGIFYIGNIKGLLTAIDIEMGEVLWQFEPERSLSGELFIPAVADGTVYAGIGGTYYAFDARTGRIRWSYDPGWTPLFWRRAFSFSSAVADGVTYFGRGHHLLGVRSDTGEEIDRYDTEGEVSSPTGEEGTVYVAGGGRLHAVSKDDWTREWHVKTGSKIWFPTHIGQSVYAPNDGGVMSVFDAETGDLRWQFTAEGHMHTPPVFTETIAFFGNHDGNLYAVARETGQKRWHYRVGDGSHFDGMASAPSISDGRVYLAIPEKTLISLDAESGTEEIKLHHG